MTQPDAESFGERERPVAPAVNEQRFEIGTDGISSVVVGFDGTVPARDALAFAIGIARRSPGRLIVVYVIQPSAIGGFSAPAAVAARQTALEEAATLGQEVSEGAALLGVAAAVVVREGDPAREIEAVADNAQADLIVVGRSHARAHAVMGSVAVALVKHAQRPVCVVP